MIKDKLCEIVRCDMEKTFRVHHILCTILYEGKGYSSSFCENMTQLVDQLRENPDEKLKLIAEPDMICENCPNKTASGECTQDANHVVIKDRLLLQKLELREGEFYSYQQLLEQAREKITEQIFEESCCNCLWYRQGVCSCRKFKNRISI